MKAEIINVSNEVVKGCISDVDASYIASCIQAVRVCPTFHTAVCEQTELIKDVINIALNRVDCVFVTGGILFSEAHLSKEAVCDTLGLDFSRASFILQDSVTLGYVLTYEGRYIVLLPSSSQSVKQMLEECVLPLFQKKMIDDQESLDVKLFGIEESEVAMKIAHLIGDFEWGNVALYRSNDEIIVSISARGKDPEVKTHIQETKKAIENCLGSFVIGYNQDRLEEILVKHLLENNYSVATVESCTGGMLAATWVGCSGVSACFNEGIITYSNEAKRKYVGVGEDTLRQFGAVSSQTAKEMAEGIRKVSGATIGLSTTGIAGPGGGTPDKPVGLVYIGIALPQQTYVYELRLKGTRMAIREQTVKHILFQLYKLLK